MGAELFTEALPRGRSGYCPLPDQKPPPLILVQVKLLNGHSFSPFAIRRFQPSRI
jgi:hypothetical protein